MTTLLEQFRSWIQRRSNEQQYFSGTFWFLFSARSEADFVRVLGLEPAQPFAVPSVNHSRTVVVEKRSGTTLKATFHQLPIQHETVRILFSLEKPSQALRPMYHLLAKTRGAANLFPFGHPLMRECARLTSNISLENVRVIRGVSYPTPPNEGGADINLKPGNAATFFARVEDEKRVLKTVTFQVPVEDHVSSCQFKIGRPGYLTYQSGPFGPLLELISEKLPAQLANSVRPFERAKGRYVQFQFSEPLFLEPSNYKIVVDALSRLPRTSIALLHTNPYFHATLTNYEDGGEFDIFITGHSTIHIRGQGDVSPASFLRLQNGLTEQFQDARVSLEQPGREHSFKDLIEGRV
jgi:hypothetical protein